MTMNVSMSHRKGANKYMKDLELVIKIPQKWFDDMIREEFIEVDELCAVIQHGILLPRGHGRLFDERDIVNGNYEIIGNKIYEVEPIIEADRSEKE